MSRFNKKARRFRGHSPGSKRYINYYQCPDCNVLWEDIWTSMCNDRCPSCNKEIEPYASKDLPQPYDAGQETTTAKKELIAKYKSPTGVVHMSLSKNGKLLACGLYAFTHSIAKGGWRGDFDHWPRTDNEVTCKNCLRSIKSYIKKEIGAYQIISKRWDEPAHSGAGSLSIFKDIVFAEEWIRDMLRQPQNFFRVRKVKVIYLED